MKRSWELIEPSLSTNVEDNNATGCSWTSIDVDGNGKNGTTSESACWQVGNARSWWLVLVVLQSWLSVVRYYTWRFFPPKKYHILVDRCEIIMMWTDVMWRWIKDAIWYEMKMIISLLLSSSRDPYCINVTIMVVSTTSSKDYIPLMVPTYFSLYKPRQDVRCF